MTKDQLQALSKITPGPICPKCGKWLALYGPPAQIPAAKCHVECPNSECDYECYPESLADFAQFFPAIALLSNLLSERSEMLYALREAQRVICSDVEPQDVIFVANVIETMLARAEGGE